MIDVNCTYDRRQLMIDVNLWSYDLMNLWSTSTALMTFFYPLVTNNSIYFEPLLHYGVFLMSYPPFSIYFRCCLFGSCYCRLFHFAFSIMYISSSCSREFTLTVFAYRLWLISRSRIFVHSRVHNINSSPQNGDNVFKRRIDDDDNFIYYRISIT